MKLSERRLNAYAGKKGDVSPARESSPVQEEDPGTGFVKTVSRSEKIRKTAKFLLLAGAEESGEILRRLPAPMVEDVMREVARIRDVDPVEAQAILKEFSRAGSDSPPLSGGVETARDLLVLALGEEKGKALLEKVLPEEEKKPFAYLDDYPRSAVLRILSREPVPAVSMILPWLKPELGAALLKSYSTEDQKKIVRRVARKRKMDREILSEIEDRIKERIVALGKTHETEERDGRDVLARILRNLAPGDEKRILGDLETEDADLGRAVRDKMYTPDTIFQIRELDLQKLLEEYSERDIALLLRDKKQDFRERMMNSISLRRRTLVEEEDLLLGQVRKSEAAAAVREFLDRIREREESGELVIFRGEDQDLVE